uniref:Methyltransferase FkbM domain-containing protein n=1 Tax=Leptocylindrus danicus TaxID=163516 RepID=A0A7S2PDT8_9STRA|mmetsp:Transcript_30384/g.44703  ORF Transcript_30384/g.44703 Transcript_30384/m.44703 type:complete len:326 (+) Transcript_30384:136-1113(+)|eukprot:CAMPEP_0116031246 /NCGR_PEP_ID=MMETSP0321-20121206/17390_1 /TAXON_ID=163516 /ORGANISM="Leptocylindrus danicus var. danicus, Strain B650" /LENGTH=325 /DNA_ID=CAMNT_0003506315 /DNA_START=31 /DNA_END=1005 /DNA_ORIENTATION=-
MVAINARHRMNDSSRNNNSAHLKSILTYGFFLALGIAIGNSYQSAHCIVDDRMSACQPIESIPQVATGKYEGFHPIYVYRGNSQAIHSLGDPPAKTIHSRNFKKGSQVNQDKIISNLWNKYKSKTTRSEQQPYFVDLAANDAIILSNTYILESEGWDGLCIEPNPAYWYRLAHRKCSVAGAFVGGSTDMEEIEVILTNMELGGIVNSGFDNKRSRTNSEKRYSVSIRTLFAQFDVPNEIQYMSLDVEGAEELIMHDFPFDAFQISFFTIERPKAPLQELLKKNGYIFVTNLVEWGETLWVHETVVTNGFSVEEIQEITTKNKFMG